MVKKTIGILFFFILLIDNPLFAGIVNIYENTFDSSADFDGAIVGDGSISIESEQLNVYIPPEASSATYVLDKSSFSPIYKSTISENSDSITWSFNISNQDGIYNNAFYFVLLSTTQNPFELCSQGYYFKGGGMVGNRMGLWRFSCGIGGGQEVLIDIPNGLGTLPDKGSYKITYNPSTNQWSLFGEIGQDYVDPSGVTTLLGSVIDDTYTSTDTPYSGMGGKTTGNVYFDNILITTDDYIPPTVTSTDPNNNGINAKIHSSISVTFSEIMDSKSIVASSFIVNDGILNIDGTISYNDRVAVFKPTTVLSSNTLYNVTVTTEVTDLGGNPIQNEYTFSFETDSGFPWEIFYPAFIKNK